ncbi:MAG: hypothetical protein Q9P90_08485 [candidate division KSB1 bacterium]|nr:hypothetical protein [candidate division KSB1 bacterium]
MVLLLLTVDLHSQVRVSSEPLPLAPALRRAVLVPDSSQTVFLLPDSLIIALSDSLTYGRRPLRRHRDYRLDYSSATVTLQFRPNGVDTLRLCYRVLPVSIPKWVARRRLQAAPQDSQAASSGAQLATRIQPQGRDRQEQAFGAQLRKSGSLVRGVSIGTGQGLKVDSGLRLQISGKISDDVEVIAALTDQNLPIQPEGNTQTLQEIDKVFIRLKGRQFGATLGDYELQFSGTEFARYQRKLQGAMATLARGNSRVAVFGAVSKGKFRTQQFMGVEGKQGPYQLTGDRGQIDIIVLAGTERVWVDGELMVRGENNDYVIEYANGQITFTRRRLITADSRITVDFQYSDERFQRNLFGAETSVAAAGDRLRITTTLLRESDDKNNPLSLPLKAEFLRALENAGDSLATVDGATYVGPGRGRYIKQDSIFVYVGPDSGDYQVRFSDVGEGRGSYRFSGFGNFTYVGPGQGRYEPVVLLPRAQSHSLADLRLEYQPAEGVQLVSEFALSRFDRNTYSPLHDDDNQGQAYLVELRFHPERWRLGSLNLGRGDVRIRHRLRNATFRDIDRINVVEYGRRWDIGQNRAIGREAVTEAQVNYEPWRQMRFFGEIGLLDLQARDLSSARWQIGTTWQRPDLLELNYRLEKIRRKTAGTDAPGYWLRQKGEVSRRIGFLRPMFRFESEAKREPLADSLQSGFRFTDWSAGLGLAGQKRLEIEVQYGPRIDDDRFGQRLRRKSLARTFSARLGVRRWHNLVASASFIHRRRDYADPQNADSRTDLAELRLGYTAWKRSMQLDTDYQISSTQVNRLQRMFFKVREGEGNYRYDADLNEYIQDPFGDYILRLIPTNEFLPVVELRSRLQLRLRPEYALRRKKRLSKWQKVLKALSSETVLRIDEKTQNPALSEIYRLNLSEFQRPEYTLFGNISLRQDVYVFQNRRSFSLRYRVLSARSLNNQFLEGGQTRDFLQHALRINVALTQKLNGRLEISRTREDKLFDIPGRQDRRIRGVQVETDLSYRPQSRWEIAGRIIFGRDRDLAFSPATQVTQFSFKPRTTYSFRSRGRLRAELEWTHVTASPAGRVIPYELAQGNRQGNTLRWNFRFEYRVSSNLNASVSYQGRDEPDRPKTLHLAKVEMRAFF